MKIDNAVWVTKSHSLDDVLSKSPQVNAIGFGSEFGRKANWDNIFDRLGASLPDLQQLTITSQYIPKQSLRKLGLLRSLKALSLYWSGIDYNVFFDALPDTLEYLDLSRTRACINHTPEQLKALLDRLTNLQTLKLAETRLIEFPRLNEPNPNLEELELFHHTIGDHNISLDETDLENIYYNFPNLKKLNINACSGISIENPKTKEIIKALALKEDFELCADEGVRNYFYLCRNIAYLRAHFKDQSYMNLNELLADADTVTRMTSYGARYLFEKQGIPADVLLQMDAENPTKFNLLTSVYFVDALKKKLVTYDQLSDLCDKYSQLDRLINFESVDLMESKKVSFDSLLMLFEKAPQYLENILSFGSRYHKTKEMIEAEIEMLVAENNSDSFFWKKLDHPNDSLQSFIVQNYKRGDLTGKDLENLFFNFPALDSLELYSGVKLRNSEQDIAIAKILLESYCLTNPKFKLSPNFWDESEPLIYKLYLRGRGISFYRQADVSLDELHRLEQQTPAQFDVFMLPAVQSFMEIMGINFAELSALYVKHQDNFKELTTELVQLFIKDKFLNFTQIVELHNTNKSKFDQLISYNGINLMKEYGVTWEELSKLYDKDPEMIDELRSLSFNPDKEVVKTAIRNKIEDFLNDKHIEQATEVEEVDSGYESDSDQYALEKDKNKLSIANSLIGFFYGMNNANTLPAFNKEQAYLAAKWYLDIVENFIPKLYKSLKYTAEKLELTLTPEQKSKFVETLANSVWYRLKHDVALNVKGNSPLYLNWSDDYITGALKAADINIDNSKYLQIFAFIGQDDQTTYQLGNDVGDCSEYLQETTENVARVGCR